MDLLILANAADDVSAMETVPQVNSPEEVYEIVSGDSLDFDSWTSLISEIEKTYSLFQDNIKAISSVYESFLSWFPLCHGYWKKYADHMARLCTVEKAVEIYEQAVQSATYSVGLWVDYCSFSILAFADPSDVRRIFERGLSYVGKDFLCHRLWDMYIRFELSQQQWSLVAHVLIRALKFPTKSLHKYYDNFREFAAFVEEDMSCAKRSNLEPFADDSNIEVAKFDDEIYHAIKELQDSSTVELRSKALNSLIAIGERFYHKSCELHEEIDYFENYMERDFFNVEPLDDEELQNWHNYLDFIEKHEDFDWAVKLYERCLIPCANYPEYWMRYVEFMESKGGRELANFALERATQVFLKNVSEVHIFNARFREKIGDIEGARAAFHLCDTESDSSFIEAAINEANMETRLGNVDTALKIYDKALKKAAQKEKMHIIPNLYIHFFRLKFMITGSADAAIDLLLAGIQQVPHSRLLLEELINFAMMHEGSKHVDVLDPIIATVVTCESDGSKGLSVKDREDLSHLYLKFVDYCGTTHDIRKAWNRHIKYFPHLIRSSSSHKYPSNQRSNELKKPKEKVSRLVAKQPSRVPKIKHISPNSATKKHKRLTSKSQPIEPHETTTANNHHIEKDNDNLVKKNNTPFQQSDDNPSKNDASKDDQIIEQEKEHEHEVDTCTPTVTNENPKTADQNPIPTTDSTQKQNETEEHEPEPEPAPQQIPSQNQPNAQQQNTSSASNLHPLPQPVQSTGQYPVQSSEQSGPIQNPQTYNQMLQYQYQYQYQQQQQSQQQWLQMQQSYQQYQQPQQYQMYQQQEQYQQYWLQMYQQQQQQMQEYAMQMQQYQQQSQQHLTQDLHQNQIWGTSHSQQGQGMIPPHATSSHTAQPMAANAPTNIMSPSNHPQSSKSLRSPSFERARET